MTKFSIVSAMVLWSLGSLSGQAPTGDDLERFNAFLGSEKTRALDEAMSSFDEFLKINFPNLPNRSDQMRAFVAGFAKFNSADPSWILDNELNDAILAHWESSGLRKDIRLYPDEVYDTFFDVGEFIIPIDEEPDTMPIRSIDGLELDLIEEEIISVSKSDSLAFEEAVARAERLRKESLRTNLHGRFLYGLAKYANNRPFINSFVLMKLTGNEISPGVWAYGILSEPVDLDDPFVRRVIMTELYWIVMRNGLERTDQNRR